MAGERSLAAWPRPPERRPRSDVSHLQLPGVLSPRRRPPLEPPHRPETVPTDHVPGHERPFARRGVGGMKKKPAKLRIVDRVYARAMQRWSSDREEGVRYLLAAIRALNHASRQELIARLPLPLAHRARHDLAARTQAKQDTRFLAEARAHEVKLQTEARGAREEEEQERIGSLLTRKSELADEPLVVFLASLAPRDRDKIATPAERRDAIDLRKASLLAGKVKALLGCTTTELNRWDADGRLPHLDVRVMLFQRATPCRCWSEAQVASALTKTAVWREQDRTRKIFGRRGLRVV